MSKLLILGGSSYVGRHLFAALGPDRAIATYNRTPLAGGVRFDSLTMDVADLVKAAGPVSQAVLLLGDTNPDTCAADAAVSRALNVDSLIRLIDRLAELGIRPVFTSSEFVFDGVRGDYAENDAAEPILLYGRQKLEVERHLQARMPDHVILRLAKIYGTTLGDRTLFTGWLDALGRQPVMRCAADQRFAPVHVDDVVAAILAAAGGALHGLYHVAGPVGRGRLELLNGLLAALRRYRPLEVTVEPCSIHDFPLAEKRPLDVTMRPDRLVRDAALHLRHPDDSCARLAALWAAA